MCANVYSAFATQALKPRKEEMNRKVVLFVSGALIVSIISSLGTYLFINYSHRNFALATCSMASQELKNGNFYGAMFYAGQAIGEDPSYYESYWLAGQAYQKLGNNESAIYFISAAIKSLENNRHHLWIRGKQKDYDLKKMRDELEALKRTQK